MNKKTEISETTDSIHMGQVIQRTLKERKISISDFAKTIHCSRTNVYSIFKRRSIDINRLKQVAAVLDLDISDLIMKEKRESNKCIVVAEIGNEDLNQLLKEYDLTYIRHWTIK